jgi:hypothetical protein
MAQDGELGFLILCGCCFNELPTIRQGLKSGFVLSCGDFICNKCIDKLTSTGICPGCKKGNVQQINLESDIPPEVADSIKDSQNTISNLYETLTFQIKNYKKMLNRSIEINNKHEKELFKANR